jgi:hypothetical protein
MVDLGNGRQPATPCTINVEFSVTNVVSAQVAVGGGYAVHASFSDGRQSSSSTKITYQPATLEWVTHRFATARPVTALFSFQRLHSEDTPHVVRVQLVKRRPVETPCGLL